VAKQKTEAGRVNQRRRTRKDLLAAAARLLKGGRTPDMDAVAEAAMVSRATAYRYFPSVEALLVEAPLDGTVPAPDDVFAGDRSTDPVARVEKAEAAMHAAVYRNEPQLRAMLAASLERTSNAAAGASADVPVRQNRRTPLIEAALAPARGRLTDGAYDNLRAALALVFGTESMIVFKDVLDLDERTARRVKAWAAQALVRAALAESASARDAARRRT
jgi:AcrR family transcriptional regulator